MVMTALSCPSQMGTAVRMRNGLLDVGVLLIIKIKKSEIRISKSDANPNSETSEMAAAAFPA
jgi:hypothetical protein